MSWTALKSLAHIQVRIKHEHAMNNYDKHDKTITLMVFIHVKAENEMLMETSDTVMS